MRFTDHIHDDKPTNYGHWTVMQLQAAMLKEAHDCVKQGRDYQRFLVQYHYPEGRKSEVQAVMHVKFEEHCITVKGYVKGTPNGMIPTRHQSLPLGYDGIEVVGRVAWEDETWQDWLD